MDKLHLNTPNSVNKNIEAIKELFPHCVVEVKKDDGEFVQVVDFDLLKQELSHALVDGEKERYQLTWPGKRESLLEANLPIAKTLRPCREESVDFDSTQNLFIEGDNLEALKLLQESYLGKVKMIYIDPPYNTGKDFIYRDKFQTSMEEHFRDSGQTDEAGNRLVANTEANGRFHSDWLSMMYPRLKLARNLLRDDGVIFISIDDNEVHNLRKICDEIFSEIGTFIWESKLTGGHDAKNVNIVHEYVLCYAKSSNGNVIKKRQTNPNYPNFDKERNEYFKWDSLWTVSHGYTKNCDYPIEAPDGTLIHPWMCHKDFEKAKGIARWYWSKAKFQQSNENDILIKKVDGGWKVYKKVCSGSNIPFKSVLSREEVGGTAHGKKDLENIFGNIKIFDYPKPISVIKWIANIASDKNSIILDFMAGSATTAHAVLELNKEDGGNRRYIMVQLQEPCDEKSQAFKQGYQTVADIGKERIRRVAKKIKEDHARQNKQPKLIDENPEQTIESPDIGFRVLKVASSSRRAVDSVPDKVKQLEIPVAIDNIKEDRSDEDILFQVLLSWGVDLSLPITVEKISGLDVFCVDGNSLVACFAKDGEIGDGVCIEIAKKEPLRVVFRDAGFRDDSAKINAEQIFKLKSPNTEIRVI